MQKKIRTNNGLFALIAAGAFLLLPSALAAAASNHQGSSIAVMQVGTVMERHQCKVIVPGEFLKTPIAPSSSEDAILVRSVIPDALEGHAYDMEVWLDGRLLGRRAGEASGFGRRSHFFPVPAEHSTTSTLTVINRSDEDLWLESTERLPKLNAQVVEASTSSAFGLGLLLTNAVAGNPELFEAFSRLRDVPGVRKAAAMELYFANQPLSEQRKKLHTFKDLCQQHGVDGLLIPCSWWAGTPPEVFARPDFQQVCFSPTGATTPTAALRQVMGDDVDPRYGMTVPNMWSNTPWPTMNHPELNQMRRERLLAAIPQVEEIMGKQLLAYVSENEPAYWAARASDYMYPVRRDPLWADFNPVTVDAAKKDGIALNPEDGLSLEERKWLHSNAARYVQDGINDLRACSPTAPVYTHALLEQHFPTEGTGHHHPYAEIARVQNARVGLETLRSTDIAALRRVREWGAWACVNREENDGFAMEYHLATLYAHYVMGADFYNSYNWDSVNQNDRALNYMDAFLEVLQNGGRMTVGSQEHGTTWTTLRNWSGPLNVLPEAPWANELELWVKASAGDSVLTVTLANGVGGPVVAAQTVLSAEAASNGPTLVSFGDVTSLPQNSSILLHLEASGSWEYRQGADGPDYRLICNMPQERRRSRWVIENAN